MNKLKAAKEAMELIQLFRETFKDFHEFADQLADRLEKAAEVMRKFGNPDFNEPNNHQETKEDQTYDRRRGKF